MFYVRCRTSISESVIYTSIIELRETAMSDFSKKVFGAILGGMVFVDLAVALTFAGAFLSE